MSQTADKSYEPTRKFLEKVTDVVWHELLLKKVVLPSEEAATRAKIAKSVLQLAGTGVTDPHRLKLYALRLVEGDKPREQERSCTCWTRLKTQTEGRRALRADLNPWWGLGQAFKN